MGLKISTTGSWPPTYDPEKIILYSPLDEQDRIVHASIERAIKDQIDLEIDILVDGQVRGDIVSIFASKIPGFQGKSLPFEIIDKIELADEAITVLDYLYAKNLAGEKLVKAHITGAMTLARAVTVTPESPYVDRNDPKLVLDLAEVLGQEARYLVEAGAEIVQIDEPSLADGVDIELAFRAMEKIIEIGEIPIPALHICKNVTNIFDDVLTKSPVKIVSIEGDWLRNEALLHIDNAFLSKCNKMIGLGCLAVRNYSVERVTTLQSFLDVMVDKLGEDNIWAVTPNCGLRHVPYEIALNKLEALKKAVETL